MVFETRQIWTSSQLPTLSVLGMKVLELSRRPETTARELLDQLHTDPALCTKIVAAANSPLCLSADFGSPTTPLANLEEATEHLGIAVVTSLTLSLLVRETCLNSGLPLPQSASLWRQAVVKAVAAETLCSQVREGLEGEYFLAGLLVDVGRFALLRTATQSYLSVLERSRDELLPLWHMEQRELGVTSAQIGAQLVEHWGLPTRLVQGIHHQFATLTTLKQAASTTDSPLWSALALASAIGDYYCSEQQAISWFRIRELTMEMLPMLEPELQSLLVKIAQRFATVAPIMSAGDVNLPPLETLKANAIAELKPIQRTTSETRRAAGAFTGRRDSGAESNNATERSFRDPLTLVFTPEFFEETLQKEAQRCRQAAAPMGIAFVQLDRLDGLIQRYGPDFNEAALKRVGDLLRDLLRSSDTIARFDRQFGILASEPTAKGMQRLADRIRGRIASEPLSWNGLDIPLTASVGATLALPGRRDQEIGTRLVAAAKKALQEASAGEGNNVYFDSLVDEVELQRLFMANHFRFSRWLIARGILDIPRVGKALLDFKQRPVRLGDLALRQELLSHEEVEQILEDQEESQARFGEVAVRRELLTEDQLVGLLILQQENPLRVAELFLQQSILDQEHLQALLKEYFSVVPWAAPLYPSAGGVG